MWIFALNNTLYEDPDWFKLDWKAFWSKIDKNYEIHNSFKNLSMTLTLEEWCTTLQSLACLNADFEKIILNPPVCFLGNIGRYLNHSCNPNVFVQNCFVDTHDLRFPWVGFFSQSHITAGKSLSKDLWRNGRNTPKNCIFWKYIVGGLLLHPKARWGLIFWTMSFYNPKKFISRSF